MSGNELILVGREAEQLRFQEVAHELLRTDERGEQRPLVMLMWGLGGIGKTTLTKMFLDIALTMSPFERDLEATRLDWEVERHSNHRLSSEPHHLDAEQVMEAIARHFDPDGKTKLFQNYQAAKKERVQAEKKVEAQLIPAGHQALAPLRTLSVKGVAQLMRLYSVFQQVPLGTLAADALEKHGEEAILSALTYLKQRVGEGTAALVAEPHGHLARALGLSLRELAKRKPLIFIQDTYEIVEAADPILREAILASGPRVLWVIAGRTNLASNDAGRRFVGYNSLADRLRLRNLPEIGEFSLGDIEGFFADAVPERPLPTGGAARVHAATLGVALAVQLAAEVWRRTGMLAEIEGGGGKGRDEIVREMSERFLVHCTDNAEKKQLYALALLRRPHPPLFQTLCGETEREAAQVLDNLARRYPFLFAADNWLHDKVRAFFHEHLLRDPVQRDAVRTLNERGWRWSLNELEQRGQGRTWEARLDSERWVDIALDYLHHLFWSDVDEGWKALPAFFLAGLAYDVKVAGNVAEIAREMETSDSRKRQQQLASLAALLQPSWNSAAAQDGIKLLRKLWGYPDTLHREETEQTAILVWAETKAFLERNDDNARDTGQRFLALLPTLDEGWEGLRARVGEGLATVGMNILAPHNTPHTLVTPDAAPYLTVATSCKDWSTDFIFWNTYGESMRVAGHIPEAIEAYHRALTLQPALMPIHNNLALALIAQGKLDEAIAACQRALTIQPDYASIYTSLGNAHYLQGHIKAALKAYEISLKLNGQSPVWYQLGVAHWSCEQPRAALKSFEKMLAIFPDSDKALHGKGKIQRQLGQWDKAETSHRKGLDIMPSSYNWVAIADLARRQGNKMLHQEAIQKAHTLMGDDSNELYFSLCLASVEGRTDEAIELLRQVVDKWVGHRAWAKQDPDLEWIRDDPRFWEIVGKDDV